MCMLIYQEATVADVVGWLCESREVIVVPGFGLCQGQAQYATAEMSKLLNENGIRVRFGIHSVAGILSRSFTLPPPTQTRKKGGDGAVCCVLPVLHRPYAWSAERLVGRSRRSI